MPATWVLLSKLSVTAYVKLSNKYSLPYYKDTKNRDSLILPPFSYLLLLEVKPALGVTGFALLELLVPIIFYFNCLLYKSKKQSLPNKTNN